MDNSIIIYIISGGEEEKKRLLSRQSFFLVLKGVLSIINIAMKTADIVYNLVKNRLPDVELKETTSLSELGLDSLDLVEITFEIEDKFNIEFTSSEIADLDTVKGVIDLIERKTK